MNKLKAADYKVTMSFGQEPTDLPQLEAHDLIRILAMEEQVFCKRLGLKRNLITSILKDENDWAFVLKVDALLESAAKHILHHGFQIVLLDRRHQNELIEDFIDSLAMNGRTSVLKLLGGAGLPPDELKFLETIRILRNAYAHNIKLTDTPLIALITSRPDKSKLFKELSGIETYIEDELIADYKQDPFFLRSCIHRKMMSFLVYASHLTAKKKRHPKPRITRDK